jgi:hypothetical protein
MAQLRSNKRYRELLLPIPRSPATRQEWAEPIRKFFEASTVARERYDDLAKRLDPKLFVDRP